MKPSSICAHLRHRISLSACAPVPTPSSARDGCAGLSPLPGSPDRRPRGRLRKRCQASFCRLLTPAVGMVARREMSAGNPPEHKQRSKNGVHGHENGAHRHESSVHAHENSVHGYENSAHGPKHGAHSRNTPRTGRNTARTGRNTARTSRNTARTSRNTARTSRNTARTAETRRARAETQRARAETRRAQPKHTTHGPKHGAHSRNTLRTGQSTPCPRPIPTRAPAFRTAAEGTTRTTHLSSVPDPRHSRVRIAIDETSDYMSTDSASILLPR
jgi:hypothetical protein